MNSASRTARVGSSRRADRPTFESQVGIPASRASRGTCERRLVEPLPHSRRAGAGLDDLGAAGRSPKRDPTSERVSPRCASRSRISCLETVCFFGARSRVRRTASARFIARSLQPRVDRLAEDVPSARTHRRRPRPVLGRESVHSERLDHRGDRSLDNGRSAREPARDWPSAHEKSCTCRTEPVAVMMIATGVCDSGSPCGRPGRHRCGATPTLSAGAGGALGTIGARGPSKRVGAPSSSTSGAARHARVPCSAPRTGLPCLAHSAISSGLWFSGGARYGCEALTRMGRRTPGHRGGADRSCSHALVERVRAHALRAVPPLEERCRRSSLEPLGHRNGQPTCSGTCPSPRRARRRRGSPPRSHPARPCRRAARPLVERMSIGPTCPDGASRP